MATAAYNPIRKTAKPLPGLISVGFLVYLVGIYTNAGPAVGDTFVVGFYALIGIGLICLSRPEYLARGQAHVLLALLFMLLFWTVLGEPSLIGERFFSFIQMTAALVAMHVALGTIHDASAARLARLFGIFTLLIVAGCVAESLLPFVRAASDGFRGFMFEGRFIYGMESNERDLSTYGLIRPNLFTQEPSHVAKAFIAFVAAWYLLTTSRYRTALLFAGTLVLLAFLRSPMVLAAIPAAVLLDRMRQGPRKVFIALLLLAPVASILVVIGAQVFEARLEMVMRGEDFSFFGRFVGPWQVAYMALTDHPFVGIGLGGKESLQVYFQDVFRDFGTQSYLYSISLTSNANAAANALAYFGLVGTPLFCVLLAAYFRKAVVPLAIVFGFFQLDGALEGVRMWGYIAVVVGAYLKVGFIPKPRKRKRRRRVTEGATYG